MDLNFRLATTHDIPAITKILQMAASRMLAQGKKQWDENYPTETHVSADIAGGVGYLLSTVGGEVVAYGAVVFDGEPAYAGLRGRWLSSASDYVVVHRLAVRQSDERRGLASRFITEVEHMAFRRGLCSFRIDTNYDNTAMLRLLEKHGFAYCGEITYESGSRLAFEKLIYNG